MNWKQLKDFCNSLPESELEKNVMLWRECEAITKIEAERLEENHYIIIESDNDDGCIPESEVNSLIKNNEDNFHFSKVYDKGHPLLHEIF